MSPSAFSPNSKLGGLQFHTSSQSPQQDGAPARPRHPGCITLSRLLPVSFARFPTVFPGTASQINYWLPICLRVCFWGTQTKTRSGKGARATAMTRGEHRERVHGLLLKSLNSAFSCFLEPVLQRVSGALALPHQGQGEAAMGQMQGELRASQSPCPSLPPPSSPCSIHPH